MTSCNGNSGQQWTHTKEGRVVHRATGRCMAAASGEQLVAAPCKASSNQIWYFDTYFD